MNDIHSKYQSVSEINVSLILTIKNEDNTIQELIDSIKNQSKKANEIIIVDGGSTDKTVSIIQNNICNKKIPIKLIVSSNANIAQGRNIAIRNSKNDIIACTDGGCKLHPEWLQNIVKPFLELDVDVVSGLYAPWFENEFEKIASYLIFPNFKKIHIVTFLPSGRSIAFKKEVWKAVGGYPEWLNIAEDTLFDLKLKKLKMKFVLARDAIVYWRVRKNIREIFKQFYNYAKGNGLAFQFLERFFIRYAIISLMLIIIYVWNSIFSWFFISVLIFTGLWIKHLRKIESITFKQIFIALLIASTIEIGILLGYPRGIITRLKLIAIKHRI